FITVMLIPLLKSAALRYNAVDVPNERKVHLHPIPRVGGLAMATGILLSVLFWAPMNTFGMALLSGSVVIVVFALIDDVINLGYRPKLLGQIMAALCVVVFGDLQVRSLGTLLPAGTVLPPAAAIPLTCFLIVAATNAINLSDGLDGLAGGLSLLIFICIGFISYSYNMWLPVFVSVAGAGAIFGFLRYNTHPAVIFMGDTGSQLLGFLAMCLSIWISQTQESLSVVLPIVILGFPLIDTLVVMVERIVRGRSPFKADKNHLHHKLMRLGLTHSEAVVAVYLHQIILVSGAFFLRRQDDGLVLGFYLVFAAIVIVGSTVTDRMGWQIPRFDLIDRVVKGHFRELRERAVPVKAAFAIIRYLAPTLLLITCFMMDAPAAYFAWICAVIALILAISALARTTWLIQLLRLALYLCIPFIVYHCNACIYDEIPALLKHAFNISHGLLAFFAILTLKFTRRRKGFRVTPMDVLILFMAAIMPYFPNPHLQSAHMGIVSARILVMIFSYEVLIGELRDQLSGQSLLFAGALMVAGMSVLVG
ncbi:MAG: glycosyltransferase family 4 protein, partial [Candidatus Promineifilaceae bacterium]